MKKLTFFKQALESAARETFVKCKEKIALEEISGFALYSDPSAMSISVSLNTFDHLEELQEDETGYETYFKWTPGEWKYEMVNAQAFADLSKQLQVWHSQVDSLSFLRYRNDVYNCAVEVLEELKEKKLFKNMSEDFVLMFAVSDFSEHALEIEYVKRLNSQPLAKEFEIWIKEEAESD